MRKIQAVAVLLLSLSFTGTLYARHRSAPANPVREVEGVLKSINDGQIVVTDNHNLDVPITVDQDTVFRRGDMAVAPADLKLGDRVEVKAVEKDNALTALLVRAEDNEQQEPELLELNGTVKSVSSTELVVTDAQGHDTTLEITPTTMIRKMDLPATAADLAIGDRVEVKAMQTGTAINALLIKDEEGPQAEIVEVNGTIKNVSSSEIVVTDMQQHDATFSIDDHTIILKNGRPAATGDLMIGDRVEVKALRMGTTATALLINDETEDQEPREAEAEGSVKATGSNQITVTTRSGDVIVKTDSNTRIRKDDTSITLADIHVGDQVEAKGTGVDSTTILASEIEVRSSSSGRH